MRGSTIKNNQIHPRSKVASGCNIINVQMGRHSFCGYNCETNHCDVGSFCSIANNAIMGGGMHSIEWASTSPVFYEGRDSFKAKFSEHKREPIKKTNIEHDFWIGRNIFIKQWIKFGKKQLLGQFS